MVSTLKYFICVTDIILFDALCHSFQLAICHTLVRGSYAMLSPPAPLISLHLLDISNDIRFKLFRRHTVCLYMHVYVCMRVCACTINVLNKGLQSRVRELGPPSVFFASLLFSLLYAFSLNPTFNETSYSSIFF